MTFEGHFGDLLAVGTLCVQLTRDLLMIAKFLVTNFSLFMSVLKFLFRQFHA